ncbi:hypothetical protein J6590_051232, partial [Homalodisca vitripennis]
MSAVVLVAAGRTCRSAPLTHSAPPFSSNSTPLHARTVSRLSNLPVLFVMYYNPPGQLLSRKNILVIAKANQMVPLYVMEVGRDYPGLAGLFMSGVMSAALSTLSAWLNAVGGILYKDFMDVFYPRVKHSEEKQSTIIKLIIVILCIISSSMVVVIEKLGTIYQVTVSMLSIAYGAT